MLTQNLMNDLKQAMKDKDKLKLTTIRSIKSALKNYEIKVGHELTEEDELQVLSTEMKQRKDSLVEFENAGRDDLADQTKAEIKIVEEYLPQQMNEAEIAQVIDDVIAETGATGKADFGKVMKALMPKVKGRADGALVNSIVKEKLG